MRRFDVTLTGARSLPDVVPAQIYFKNQQPAPGTQHPAHLPLPDVLALVTDSFTGATERHIEASFFCLFRWPRVLTIMSGRRRP